MARFTSGDSVRLNYRKSKEGYYGSNGRTAVAEEYLGKNKWSVELPNGKTRKWFTADMDNINREVILAEGLKELLEDYED